MIVSLKRNNGVDLRTPRISFLRVPQKLDGNQYRLTSSIPGKRWPSCTTCLESWSHGTFAKEIPLEYLYVVDHKNL